MLSSLFGAGTVLLVGGLVAKEFAKGSVIVAFGKGAANVGGPASLYSYSTAV